MAVGRYLSVSQPFRFKPLIDLRSTRSTIVVIFVVSFLVNVPRFFENDVQSIPCLRQPSFKVIYRSNYLVIPSSKVVQDHSKSVQSAFTTSSLDCYAPVTECNRVTTVVFHVVQSKQFSPSRVKVISGQIENE